jgi:hypothetical protein
MALSTVHGSVLKLDQLLQAPTVRKVVRSV